MRHDSINDKIMLLMLWVSIFSLPFGSLQEKVIGITVVKLLMGLGLVFVLLKPAKYVLLPYLTSYVLFIICTLPSLYLAPEIYPFIVPSFVGYAVLGIIIYSKVDSSVKILTLYRGYLIGLVIVSLFVLLAIIGVFDVGSLIGEPLVDNILGLKRIMGTEDNPNAFAVYFIVGIPIVIHEILYANTSIQKIWLTLILGLFGLLLLISVSRGAFLGTMGALGFYMVLRAPNTVLKSAILGVCLVGSLWIALNMDTIVPAVLAVSKSGTDANLISQLKADKAIAVTHRINTAKFIYGIFSDYPITGVGFGQFKREISNRGLYYALGAHNIYLAILVEFGLFAFISFVLFIYFHIRRAAITIRKIGRSQTRPLLVLSLSIFIGLQINGLFHENYINVLFWFLIALLASSVRVARINFENHYQL